MYTDFLINEFQDMLEDVPLQTRANMWFLQDGAPPHFSVTARQALSRIFPNRWVGRGGPVPWPPRSPDLNALDYFLWGHLKTRIYSRPIDDVDTLRERIIVECDRIRNNPEMLRNACSSMERRVNACILAEGGKRTVLTY